MKGFLIMFHGRDTDPYEPGVIRADNLEKAKELLMIELRECVKHVDLSGFYIEEFEGGGG